MTVTQSVSQPSSQGKKSCALFLENFFHLLTERKKTPIIQSTQISFFSCDIFLQIDHRQCSNPIEKSGQLISDSQIQEPHDTEIGKWQCTWPKKGKSVKFPGLIDIASLRSAH